MVDLAPREVTEGFVLVVIVAIVDVNVGITCMMLVLLHEWGCFTADLPTEGVIGLLLLILLDLCNVCYVCLLFWEGLV